MSSVTIGSLRMDQQYPVVHTERLNTFYDLNVLLAIIENPTTSVEVFLPKRYVEVLSDEDIGDISSRVLLNRFYKGHVLI